MSNKLTPMIIEITPVNERIMRIWHSLAVISLVSVYAPTEASDLIVRKAVLPHSSQWLSSPPGKIFFSSWGISMNRLALIGMAETGVGPHGSGTVNQNSTKFLDFAGSHGHGL